MKNEYKPIFVSIAAYCENISDNKCNLLVPKMLALTINNYWWKALEGDIFHGSRYAVNKLPADGIAGQANAHKSKEPYEVLLIN